MLSRLAQRAECAAGSSFGRCHLQAATMPSLATRVACTVKRLSPTMPVAIGNLRPGDAVLLGEDSGIGHTNPTQ